MVAHRADSACSQGRVTAALKPVPGSRTTRGRPAPAEVSATGPALVARFLVVRGKSACVNACEHQTAPLAGPGSCRRTALVLLCGRAQSVGSTIESWAVDRQAYLLW